MGLIRHFIRYNRAVARKLEARFPSFFGAESYKDRLLDLISMEIERRKPNVVLEAGGIDRPMLHKADGFKYVGLDVEERSECYEIYDQFLVQSVEDPARIEPDLIISTTLLEHVPDNERAVRAMFTSLRPGGGTYHYIPSKWHPYSIALRLVGPKLQRKLIPLLRPEAVEVTGYPAFFDHCSPRSMEQLFRLAGFRDIRVEAFYRASDYFSFFIPAYLIVVLYENVCRAFGFRWACSGFIISALK